MAKKRNAATSSIGSISFLFGALIAIVIGVISPAGPSGLPTTTLTSLLILLGLVVGLLNVTRKETNSFLIAAVSLIIVSTLGGAVLGEVEVIGQYLENILVSILTFVVPAAVIVAIRAIYALEEN